jgi:hypothetical protein
VVDYSAERSTKTSITMAREKAQRMAGARYGDAALGAVIVSGQAGLRMTGGPWWAVALLAVLGLAVAALRIVFPQDSPDRLEWWLERRRTSRRGDAGDERRTAVGPER